jgi:S1-C subfamily serine protease
MRITCGLVGAWVVALLLFGSGIAQEVFVPKLEPMPSPGVAGSAPSVLSMGGMSQLLPDGISPKKAEAVLSRIPGTERRTRGVHDVALFRLLSPSVVLVVTNEGIGSGSVISGGLILTNWHVVEGYKQVGVVFKSSSPGARASRADVIAADVIKVDQVRDLVLLRPLTFPTSAPKPIELADEKDIAIGADVHAIGHPTGEAWSYTKGIISQVRNGYSWETEAKIKHHADVIQTQTPINPGNSGGPLLSDEGKLIGVNAFKAEGEALNFAVAVTDVRRFLAATSNVVSSNRALASQSETKECTGPKVVYEGRDKADEAFIRSVSLRCDDFADLIFVLPDNDTKAMYALFDSKRRKKADAIIFDPSREGNWKLSYWDTNLDDTFPLEGVHANGELKPVSFKKRCSGQALLNFKCS